jgi:hypothetical protein
MKAIIKMGYKDYVMDADKALTLLGALDGAEVYESKYDHPTKTTSYFVYAQDNGDNIREMKLLPDALYKLAKLAGKPNKEQ